MGSSFWRKGGDEQKKKGNQKSNSRINEITEKKMYPIFITKNAVLL